MAQGKKILIVEDDGPMRQTLGERFKHEGFNVITAVDGDSGIAMSREHHPDLLIVDILLPHTDGISMLKQIRVEGEWGKSVPVIILTNLPPHSEEMNEAIASTEPAYFLTKSSITPKEIVERVRERLG